MRSSTFSLFFVVAGNLNRFHYSQCQHHKRSRDRAEEIYMTGLSFLKAHLTLTFGAMQKLVNQPQPAQKPLLLWILRPKYHYLFHQLVELRRVRVNIRHSHTFTDEDSMRWLKTISKKVKGETFEKSVMRISRLRLSLTKKKAKVQNWTASRRNKLGGR